MQGRAIGVRVWPEVPITFAAPLPALDRMPRVPGAHGGWFWCVSFATAPSACARPLGRDSARFHRKCGDLWPCTPSPAAIPGEGRWPILSPSKSAAPGRWRDVSCGCFGRGWCRTWRSSPGGTGAVPAGSRRPQLTGDKQTGVGSRRPTRAAASRLRPCSFSNGRASRGWAPTASGMSRSPTTSLLSRATSLYVILRAVELPQLGLEVRAHVPHDLFVAGQHGIGEGAAPVLRDETKWMYRL